MLFTEFIKEELSIASNVLGKRFTPKASIIGVHNALEQLDVFLWCGDIYIVESSGLTNIAVRCLDGRLASNNWVWDYRGEPAYKLGTISEKGLSEVANWH